MTINLTEAETATENLLRELGISPVVFCVTVCLWRHASGNRALEIVLSAFDASGRCHTVKSADWHSAIEMMRGELSPSSIDPGSEHINIGYSDTH